MQALPAGGYAETANLTGTPIEELGTKTGTKGQLRGRSVNICSDIIIPFFQSLSPSYQLPTGYEKSVSFDSVSYASRPVELTKQSNFSRFCLSCGEVVAGMTSALCLTAGSVGGKVIQYVRGETVGLSRPMTLDGLSTGALAVASIITLSQLPISAARPVPTQIAMTHWTSWPTISTTAEPFVDSIGGEIMGWTLVAVALVGLGMSAYCFMRQFCGEYVEQTVNAYGDNQERLAYLINDRWRAINYGAVGPIF